MIDAAPSYGQKYIETHGIEAARQRVIDLNAQIVADETRRGIKNFEGELRLLRSQLAHSHTQNCILLAHVIDSQKKACRLEHVEKLLHSWRARWRYANQTPAKRAATQQKRRQRHLKRLKQTL